MSVLSGCPLERGVRKARVDCIDKFTNYFKTSFNGKFHRESRCILSCEITLYAICQMFQFIDFKKFRRLKNKIYFKTLNFAFLYLPPYKIAQISNYYLAKIAKLSTISECPRSIYLYKICEGLIRVSP